MRRSKRIQKKLLLIIAITGALVLVLLKVFSENISLFLKPAEVYEMKNKPTNEVRIGGYVNDLKFDKETESFSFVITDGKNDIFVKYKGMLPSLFKEGQMAVVIGNLVDCDSVHQVCFKACGVLAKHDENYRPPLDKKS